MSGKVGERFGLVPFPLFTLDVVGLGGGREGRCLLVFVAYKQ